MLFLYADFLNKLKVIKNLLVLGQKITVIRKTNPYRWTNFSVCIFPFVLSSFNKYKP